MNKHDLVINSQSSSSWFLKEPQKVETKIWYEMNKYEILKIRPNEIIL